MLEPWIIEQIRRREEEERRRRNERPQLEVPVRDERWKHPSDEDGDSDKRDKDKEKDKERDEDGNERGVAIIDF